MVSLESSVLDEAALESGLAEMESARSWSPRVVSKLEALIRGDDERALFRVNPLKFGDQRDIDGDEAIDLFLHATNAGLFEMEWAIVCITCSNIFKSFRKLERVDPHFACPLCNMENEATLDEFIQVMFTVSPAIRDIYLHHPERLTLEELIFDYHHSQDIRAQYDGHTASEIFRSWTIELTYLEPEDSISLDADVRRGPLICRDPLFPDSIGFVPGPNASPGELSVVVELGSEGMTATGIEVSELVFETPIGNVTFPQIHMMSQASLSLQVINRSTERRALWVVHYPPIDQVKTAKLEFDPVLTGKRLLTNSTFHLLFRAEMPPESEGLTVNDLTYLFTDLSGSTAMYDEIGDVTAYNLVRLHFEVLNRAVIDNGGVVVKTIGDAIMATFLEPSNAVAAALEMMSSLDDFNRSMSASFELKVGIHRGFSMAVNLNDRLDYFGQNVNIAARTQQLSEVGVLITADVADAPGVSEVLDGYELAPVSSPMKGVTEEIPVFKLSAVQT